MDGKFYIDIAALRRDLMDDMGSAMYGGFPMAVIDLSEVESASPDELVQIALRKGYNLRKYEIT